MYGRKNTENMLRKVNERIGMTFGQIMSILTLLGALIVAWLNLNLKIEQHDGRIGKLEEGKITNAQNIEKVRIENREDHQLINNKLDEIIKEIHGK